MCVFWSAPAGALTARLGHAQSLSQNQPEAHQIREIIDVEHIKSQLKEGSLDFMGCERLIGGIIGVVANVHHRMKATERKEETLAKWKECQAEMQEANGKERVGAPAPSSLAPTHPLGALARCAAPPASPGELWGI